MKTEVVIINEFNNAYRYVESGFQKNEDFFGKGLEKTSVYIANTKSDFDYEYGCITASWISGYPRSLNDHILVLHPDLLEKKYKSKKEHYFAKIITHEINHRFMLDLYSYDSPTWIFEGLAGSIAGQANERFLSPEKVYFPIEDMWDSGFYANREISYIKSACLVNYMLNQAENPLQLVLDLKNLNKSKANTVLEAHINQTYDELEQSWIDYLNEKYQ